MTYKPNPEYEKAHDRICTLIEEIGDQLAAINSKDDVDTVVAEQEKNDFIFKLTEIISAYHDRDAHDECGARIVELEAKLASAEKKAKQESDRWFMEFQNNQHLKNALKSLTAVIAQDALC